MLSFCFIYGKQHNINNLFWPSLGLSWPETQKEIFYVLTLLEETTRAGVTVIKYTLYMIELLNNKFIQAKINISGSESF